MRPAGLPEQLGEGGGWHRAKMIVVVVVVVVSLHQQLCGQLCRLGWGCVCRARMVMLVVIHAGMPQ